MSPFSVKDFEEKPYNTCLNCIHIGKKCDGPNFLAMDTERWCEWCRLRKEYLRWTNAHVAELSGISKISVDRIMSGNIDDLRLSTMRAITKVLVNGSWGQYPCVFASLSEPQTVYLDSPALMEKAEKAARECERLQAVLEKLTEEHRASLADAHSADQRKIDFLKEQVRIKDEQLSAKDRQIAELISALAHRT